MSDEIVEDTGMSNEPMSTEIGSGAVEDAVVEDAGIAVEADGAEVDKLAGEIEDAVEAGATDAEIQQMVETFKLKVNGQEKEVTLDWNNKDDIVRRLQMAEAGQSAMQRSAELERSFETALQNLSQDPWEVLKELGLDPDELAEQRIQAKIAELQKSPEQLAAEARDKELEDLRQKLRKQEEEREQIEFQRLQEQAEIDLDRQITDALSSTTELPKSPYVVKRIADAMLMAMENGHEDVSASDVIPWVEKEINSEMQNLFGAMPDKMLESYLGNKTIDRLRQSRLSKMKTQPVKSIKETGKAEPKTKEEKKKISLNSWLRHGSSLNDFE